MRFVVPTDGLTSTVDVEPGFTYKVGLQEDPLHRPVEEVLKLIRGHLRLIIETYFMTGLLPDGTRD
jgi:hypothetical protein